MDVGLSLSLEIASVVTGYESSKSSSRLLSEYVHGMGPVFTEITWFFDYTMTNCFCAEMFELAEAIEWICPQKVTKSDVRTEKHTVKWLQNFIWESV